MSCCGATSRTPATLGLASASTSTWASSTTRLRAFTARPSSRFEHDGHRWIITPCSHSSPNVKGNISGRVKSLAAHAPSNRKLHTLKVASLTVELITHIAAIPSAEQILESNRRRRRPPDLLITPCAPLMRAEAYEPGGTLTPSRRSGVSGSQSGPPCSPGSPGRLPTSRPRPGRAAHAACWKI